MKRQLSGDYLLEVLNDIKSAPNGPMSPKKFIDSLPMPWSAIDAQRDATEFYGCFIQQMALCKNSVQNAWLMCVSDI